ncbi:hypothetical protein [Sinosporangium siamense]|uniref:Uncharacterized protein n=1 Tax=Sinosporangium siamense TaxID=1367973 RepID=A0A919VFJ8_9ACTN|nr:hypothetical protein [Sinosporangium siamense]GII96199.1 hypothetical protein Ssi02_64300 [Sinosporangium siamense]
MPRETLTKEQIIRTAIELLDEEGPEGLDMRSLGRRLGPAELPRPRQARAVRHGVR